MAVGTAPIIGLWVALGVVFGLLSKVLSDFSDAMQGGSLNTKPLGEKINLEW